MEKIFNIILWMRMDDLNSSGQPRDLSSYGNNGTLVNGAKINRTGYLGNGSHYDGDGDYIKIPYSNYLNLTNDLTISVWAFPVALDQVSTGIVDKTGAQAYRAIFLGTEAFQFGYTNESGTLNSYTTSAGLDISRWYHFVATKNSTNVTVYLNGNINFTGSVRGKGLGAVGELEIGRRDGLDTRVFNGSIDEVMIWNRSLSADEIKALYNATANKYYNNFSGLAAKYHSKFDFVK